MKRFKNILFVSEGTINDASLLRALKLASVNNANISILYALREVLPKSSDISKNIAKQLVENSSNKLDDLCHKKGITITPKSVTTFVEFGEPFIDTIRTVLKEKIDLVFKSISEKKKSSLGFLTFDMHLLRKCPCPLWLHKGAKNNTEIKILATISPKLQQNKADELTKKILELATSLRVIENNAQLKILNCWEVPYEDTLKHSPFIKISKAEMAEHVSESKQKQLQAYDKALSKFDLSSSKINTHFERAAPEDYIPKFVNKHKIDTLIMGTVGRTGISGLFIGNTAENILRSVNCSVIAVKPQDFISPVTL